MCVRDACQLSLDGAEEAIIGSPVEIIQIKPLAIIDCNLVLKGVQYCLRKLVIGLSLNAVERVSRRFLY